MPAYYLNSNSLPQERTRKSVYSKELFYTSAKYGQTILDRFVCPDKGGAEVVDTLRPSLA